MSDDTQTNRPNIFPALRYQDAPAALAWLEQVFGFEQQLVMPGPAGTVAHAQLTFGPGVIMLGSAATAEEPRTPWETVRQGIYVYVEDIDAHYARAQASGAEIVHELGDRDYGSREYSVKDLEGHLWSFGTYLPDSADDDSTS